MGPSHMDNYQVCKCPRWYICMYSRQCPEDDGLSEWLKLMDDQKVILLVMTLSLFFLPEYCSLGRFNYVPGFWTQNSARRQTGCGCTIKSQRRPQWWPYQGGVVSSHGNKKSAGFHICREIVIGKRCHEKSIIIGLILCISKACFLSYIFI